MFRDLRFRDLGLKVEEFRDLHSGFSVKGLLRVQGLRTQGLGLRHLH